jgi:hypothetical protein
MPQSDIKIKKKLMKRKSIKWREEEKTLIHNSSEKISEIWRNSEKVYIIPASVLEQGFFSHNLHMMNILLNFLLNFNFILINI